MKGEMELHDDGQKYMGARWNLGDIDLILKEIKLNISLLRMGYCPYVDETGDMWSNMAGAAESLDRLYPRVLPGAQAIFHHISPVRGCLV